MTGLLGGVFDPPHLGHVALAEGALRHLPLDELIVLVADRPGHKTPTLDGPTRLELARLAFGDLPRTRVELDEHAYTVDLVRDRPYGDAVFLIGSDEWADFESWKDPGEVLKSVKLGVAARRGYARPEQSSDRVLVFEIEPVEVSAREIRRRAARGLPLERLVPPGVAAEIERRGLYRPSRG